MKLATLCYVMDGDKTLMLYRNKKENDYHEGKWNGLGGKLEQGETPEECAIREVYEESGLKVSDPEMKGLITFPMFDGVDDWYVWVFVFKKFDGKQIDSPEGTLEWIQNNKLTGLNLWDGDKIFIPWLFENKCFSSKFIYEDGKYISHQVNFY
ncbi:MAG: 8-oxo-dGTP diphosphatase [Ignavibacteriae bacterium]|nr:8-oxo-dGTP diphosphatase [Ignavibacteriota bacterium]